LNRRASHAAVKKLRICLSRIRFVKKIDWQEKHSNGVETNKVKRKKGSLRTAQRESGMSSILTFR